MYQLHKNTRTRKTKNTNTHIPPETQTKERGAGWKKIIKKKQQQRKTRIPGTPRHPSAGYSSMWAHAGRKKLPRTIVFPRGRLIFPREFSAARLGTQPHLEGKRKKKWGRLFLSCVFRSFVFGWVCECVCVLFRVYI